jgi:hypothetical protein
MLIAAVAFVVLQGRGHAPSLRQKLALEAKSHGWTYMPGDIVSDGPRDNVDCRLAYGSHYLTVRVSRAISRIAAAQKLKKAIATSDKRTPMEEPSLKSTGLSVDVADYSNKRLSNLKAYAASNMRVSGIVKNNVVFMEMEPPPSAAAPMPKPKTEEQVYGDVVGFAKFIAKELKTP